MVGKHKIHITPVLCRDGLFTCSIPDTAGLCWIFCFPFYPLHILSKPFLREGGILTDGVQKFGLQAILMAFSSSLQQEIM